MRCDTPAAQEYLHGGTCDAGRRLPPEALFLLGLERASGHATYHYFLKALDVDAVEQVLGAWVHEHGPADHLALDGKRLRGSAPGDHDGREGVHLVSTFASRLSGVVGQLRVPPDGNEITAALALLKGLPPAVTIGARLRSPSIVTPAS